MAGRLAGKWGEAPILALGHVDGTHFEVWQNESNQSWTILRASRELGRACVMATGHGVFIIEPPPPGEEL